MRNVSEKVLQEYLAVLANDGETNSAERSRELLSSYAEFRFRILGGSHCNMCHAAVRHVLPVTVTRENGAVTRHECLCQRCLEAERATARCVEMAVGRARWVWSKSAPRSRAFRKGA